MDKQCEKLEVFNKMLEKNQTGMKNTITEMKNISLIYRGIGKKKRNLTIETGIRKNKSKHKLT